MNFVLACVLGYVGSQLLIALFFSRRTKNEEDFLLAGRAVGPTMMVFSVFGTWFGAETCIGAAGEAYAHGLSGVIADPFGYTAGLVLTGLFFATALWKRGLLTLADLFRQRYGAGVERVAALIMIPASLMWGAAQIRAFGEILSSVSTFSLFPAITFAAAVVIVYTAFGGMWVNVVTDLVHGIILVAGLIVMAVVFVQIGGWQVITQLPPERLSFMHERTLADALNTLAVPIFSTIAAQELAARLLAGRSARVASAATAGGGFLYLAIGVIPVMIGLGATAFIGEGANTEQVLSLFAQKQLPLPLYILFLGALVSAILSTLSGALLVAGGVAGHNLIKPFMQHAGAEARLRVDRIAVVVLGIVAYVIALQSESVYGLVQQSSALGSSGILVMMVFAIWGRQFGGKAAAYAALLAGTGVWLLGEHVFVLDGAYILSLVAAFAAYVATAVLTGTSPSSHTASSTHS